MFPVEDMIVLACADRYLCSHRSVGMRAWSSIRVANRVIPFAILLGFLAYSHVPILFQIEIHPMTQKPICYRPDASGTYHIVLSYFHLIYFGLSPSFCMLLFGLLTLRNIEKSKRNAVGLLTTTTTTTANAANQITRIDESTDVSYVVGSSSDILYDRIDIFCWYHHNIYQCNSNEENLLNAVIGMLATLCNSIFDVVLSNLSKEIFNSGKENSCQHLSKIH